MASIKMDDYLSNYNNIAIYGLSTETERFLSEWSKKINVVGLLDGFKTDGDLYGYPIISMEAAVLQGVDLIIVVARPGSCKVIVKRIGQVCKENNIALFDVRGRNLLEATPVRFEFQNLQGKTKGDLLKKIELADVVSFDLFDTLVMRKVMSYTDIFDLMDRKLRLRGIYIPDFSIIRTAVEKSIAFKGAPTLEVIYSEFLKQVGGAFIDKSELAEIEWEIDLSCLIPRYEVCEVFNRAASSGKTVIVTTDSYYRKEQIETVLKEAGLSGYDEIFDSCEYNVSKKNGLFKKVLKKYHGRFLHIGDDEYSDIGPALKCGLDTYRLYKGEDLFDALGGVGASDRIGTLSDRVKAGLFIAKEFNSPFWFEEDKHRLTVKDSKDIGYLFCAPMITDFILWLKSKIKEQDFHQILFCARDGYLIGRLYRKQKDESKTYYFLASRAAAIRAGMESEEDISYVDSMKYFGTATEALSARFGISEEGTGAEKYSNRSKRILDKSKEQRNNYKKYIEKFNLGTDKLAMFDFVAKGTTQLYLQRLFPQHMKGFYFLQLEPEFMAGKRLDIEPFYSDKEKNISEIYDNYYILETLLTSPYPQTAEFDKDGKPVFVQETRSKENIGCFERAQLGIEEYFEDYIRLLPEDERKVNKELDEVFLSLVNKIQILDEDFLNLKVEDPFFGRMTDIREVIG